MNPTVTLIIREGSGIGERRTLEAGHLSIGRGADNGWVIDDQGVSRRHAVIEAQNGAARIRDCSSTNGTLVNDRPVNGAQELKDGDVISIGGKCRIGVQINFSAPPVKPRPHNAKSGRAMTPVIAVGAMIAIIAICSVVYLKISNKEVGSGQEELRVQPSSQQSPALGSKPVGAPGPEQLIQIQRDAEQLMRRVSKDTSYVFPPYVPNEIKQKLGQYSSSITLVEALKLLQSRGADLASQARRDGITPALLLYLSLAETDGGQSGDLLSIARQVLPRLISLQTIFGGQTADGSLLIVAAYKIPGGTMKSHPLLEALRQVVKDPRTDRSVWRLRERQKLNQAAYDFVIRFLALGIIARNPQQYGIDAPRLDF